MIYQIFFCVVSLSTLPLFVKCQANICPTATWSPNGVTVAGGHRSGSAFNQLNTPIGILIDDDQTIFVADTSNHRIVKWKANVSSGSLVAGGNGKGDRLDQLNSPQYIAMDKDKTIYIGDWGNQRLQRWIQNTQSGKTILGNITLLGITFDNEGSFYLSDYINNQVTKWRLGQTTGQIVALGLNIPRMIRLDSYRSVYVADAHNHRIMKFNEGITKGIVVAGRTNDSGSAEDQLNYPRSVIVDDSGSIYVADTNNHRIMRWLKGATSGTLVVGGRGG
ncbi:unnamed protein product, partial [Adineta ricciae]